MGGVGIGRCRYPYLWVAGRWGKSGCCWAGFVAGRLEGRWYCHCCSLWLCGLRFRPASCLRPMPPVTWLWCFARAWVRCCRWAISMPPRMRITIITTVARPVPRPATPTRVLLARRIRCVPSRAVQVRHWCRRLWPYRTRSAITSLWQRGSLHRSAPRPSFVFSRHAVLP